MRLFRLDKSARFFYNTFVMENEYIFKPIAHIRSDFKEKFGIPRQSGRAPALQAEIVFLPEYRKEEAFREIEGFSHLWILFDFSKAHQKEWSPTVRPPRLGGNKRVGVFASRSPFRPNPIGLSCVKLVKLKQSKTEGPILVVSGADLLDGTPIFDVKPYLPFADSHPDASPGYAASGEFHALEVRFPASLLEQIPKDKQEGLMQCLADDPRPSYQEDPARVYGMRFGDAEIKFNVQDGILTVLSIEK